MPSRWKHDGTRRETLGRYAVYFHDPTLINTILAKYSDVTPDDIRRVARQYLGDTQRTLCDGSKSRGGPASPACERPETLDEIQF